MPLIPEKRSSRQNARRVISSQFWEQPVHSSRSIDGLSWSLACEPQPLNLTGASGLSRTQQLLAAQAIGAPAIPSYEGHSGGVVLDRVLARVGGYRWWTAVSGRVKAQRIVQSIRNGAGKLNTVKDLSNYSICTRSRFQIGRQLTCNVCIEAPDIQCLKQAQESPGLQWSDACKTHSLLRLTLPGHDVTATYSRNLDYIDCNGEYAKVNIASSLDLVSHDRGDGLQYRVGLYQVAAPPSEDQGRMPSISLQRNILRTTLHAQGAVAVEGEAYLWKAGGKNDVTLSGPNGNALLKREGISRQSSAKEEGSEEGNRVTSAINAAASLVVDDEEVPLQHLSTDSSSDVNLDTTERVVPVKQDARSLPVTSDDVAVAMKNAEAVLSDLRSTVVRLTQEIQDGSLQRLSEQLSRKGPSKRRPHSVLLAVPHLKLNAAMGCLARMPLPALQGVLGFPGEPQLTSSKRNASTSSLASFSSQLAEAWEPYLKGTALRLFASAAVTGQLGRFSRAVFDYTAFSLRADIGLTSPHVVGLALNPTNLASLGESQSNIDRHRAFALDGRGSWHALSASISQQVIGPVRAHCDLRFALDPTNVPEDEGQRSTLRGIAQTAVSVRPCLLETVWGLDSVLPGTGGGARVALWYAPKRKEAMAELRLF